MKKFDLNIDKYGVSLSVKDKQFLVRSKEHRQMIAPNKIREITLSKSTSITGAAIKLALDSDIDISFVERDQMPYARVWNSKFGSITTIRRSQLSFSASIDGSEWIKNIILQKIKNQMSLVSNLALISGHQGPSILQFRSKLSSYMLRIDESQSEDALILANQLRGWEANASKLFFRCLSALLPECYRFEKRSRRPALDPFNATLNYCYGILYNKIEGMMIRAGLDPHIGIFHKDQYNRPVLVYDIIELFRHWAEYPVMQCFIQGLTKMEYYEHTSHGVLILPPGKKIIIETLFSYWNERIEWKGERAKRILHIQQYIQNFATQMKNYKIDDVKKSGI